MAPVGIDQLRALLRSSDLLGMIPDHELEALARHARRTRRRRGTTIYRKRDAGTDVMFVASGRVKIVSAAPSGAEVIHNIIEEGQVFGEVALLDGKPRSAEAIALVDTDIIEISRPDFLAVLRRNPDVAIQMMEILCGRLRQSTSFVEDAVLLDASTRLFHRIRTLGEQLGQRDEDGVSLRIDHRLSQQEIGESVGLTRVSVNRLLGQWRAAGLIQDGRGYLVIPDLDRLERATRDGGGGDGDR